MTAARAHATYEDLLALPEGVTGEIIYGALVTHPRPRPRHANAGSTLGGDLHGAFQRGRGGPGGWWILDEPEVHASGHVVAPDLGGWRVERMAELPETAYFPLAPDWVCEVLSRGTAKRDRGSKMDAYAEMGVGHLWLVDVDVQTVEIYRREGGNWLRLATFADEALFRAEPFDAVELDLGALWRAPVRR